MSGMGHNSGGSVESKELILLAERIERLIDDRKNINDDIKDVKAEAKARGYDPRTLMEVIKIRAQRNANLDVYNERQAILQTYLVAFGIED